MMACVSIGALHGLVAGGHTLQAEWVAGPDRVIVKP